MTKEQHEMVKFMSAISTIKVQRELKIISLQQAFEDKYLFKSLGIQQIIKGGNYNDPILNKLHAYLTRETKLSTDIAKLDMEIQMREDLISQISSNQIKLVFMYRYLEELNWDDVIKKMQTKRRQIFNWHIKGLNELIKLKKHYSTGT